MVEIQNTKVDYEGGNYKNTADLRNFTPHHATLVFVPSYSEFHKGETLFP